MKEIYRILWIISILIFIIGCIEYNDDIYFNGNIHDINSKIKKVKSVSLNPVPLEGPNYGRIAVHDSLMFFMNPKLPNHFFNVFNLDTGKEIGLFCNKGQGPNEVAAVSYIYQFFEEKNELKTLLFAANENVIIKWNISQSIKQKTTVIDSIIPYSNNRGVMGARYNYIFYQDIDTLFTYIQSLPINDEEASLPFYQKRTLYTDKTLKDYPIYRNSIKNGLAYIIPEAFFNSNDTFKPDGTKIVQAMTHLYQLNIIDTKTGEINGFRMHGSPDFSIFQKKKKVINTNYVRIQADDQYIYATYWGKDPWSNELPFINTIHVFDWNGCLLYELISDHPIHEIWLDNVRNRLYTTNMDTDEVFYINLEKVIDSTFE
ncbi:Hypothetical protein PEIBARAKI_5872 [Petrimonas sp. IBARAKI]|nr:Hypothetical protein PEIBARAKI_5872 [Petrimonas sp. IBARAKI]